jgi:hypothetical protein
MVLWPKEGAAGWTEMEAWDENHAGWTEMEAWDENHCTWDMENKDSTVVRGWTI